MGLGRPAASAARRERPGLARQHQQRVAHAGQLGHALEQLDPGEVVPAEHVALARPAALGRQHVALGHVAHVHHVGLAVHEGGQPPAQVAPDHARGGLPGRAAVHRHAEDVGRVHDHHLDAVPGAGRERLRLALVLGVRIGEPEPAAAIEVVLAADLAGRGRADAGHARGDHHAADVLGGGGLHRDARRQRVHLPDPLGGVRAHESGTVEDGVAAAEGPPQRRSVEHVRLDRLGVGVAQACQPRLFPVRDTHRATFGRKFSDVRADEPGGARYTDRHNFRVGNLFVRSYTPGPP